MKIAAIYAMYSLAAASITLSCAASTQGDFPTILIGNFIFGFAMSVIDAIKENDDF